VCNSPDKAEGLQLAWHANECKVHTLGSQTQDSTEVPLQKSLCRAILVRMAALCNEGSPNSISPYGGEGDLSVGTDPPAVFHEAFTSIPGEQRLVVRL